MMAVARQRFFKQKTWPALLPLFGCKASSFLKNFHIYEGDDKIALHIIIYTMFDDRRRDLSRGLHHENDDAMYKRGLGDG